MPAPAFVFVAEMQSEHYKWVSVGRTAKEAVKAMAARWDANAAASKRRYPQSLAHSWDEGIDGTPTGEHYGLWVRKMRVGQAYMEDEEEGVTSFR